MFMNNGESYYKIAALCGKDTKTLKDMLEKAINCELRSMVQCLYKFGFTIEIRIVRRKSLNGNAQIELEGRKTGIA
jgi:hypothetical protein